jgi:putative ABC transport system permease protein
MARTGWRLSFRVRLRRPAAGELAYKRSGRAGSIARVSESFWQDVRYASRNLRRQPGFTFVALSILTLGIGLNTALFTIFKEAVLQPWSAVAEPDRVVRVHGADPDIGSLIGLSHPEYLYLADHAASVSGLAAWRNESVRFEDDATSDTRVTLATANFFQVLTRSMERGRGFLPDDDPTGAPRPVAVVSAEVWRRRLDSDPNVLGRTVRLDGVPFSVIGVAPRMFAGSEGSTTSVWVPFGTLALLRPNDPVVRGIDEPTNCCSQIVGRLAAGVTEEQAASELQLLSDRFRKSVAEKPRPLTVAGTSMMPAHERFAVLTGGAVLFVALLLVLMLACANIGNLLLAKAAARAREISVRLALGATRRRIVRQLLTESLVLALIAGGAGLFISMQVVPMLRVMVGPPDGVPYAGSVDWLVLLCTFAIAGLACLAFGLAPALHATRPQLPASLTSERALTPTRLPLRNLLLGMQVTVSVIFLAFAGLFVRGVQKAYLIDLGFALDDVMVAEIDLPANAHDTEREGVFLNQVAAQLRTPNGPPVGVASWEPLSGSRGGAPVRHPGQTADEARNARSTGVSSGYFDVLRIPIVAGRNFAPNEAGSRPVVVNQRFAALLWPGQDPIGRRFLSRHKDPLEHEVIGVAKDVMTDRMDGVEPTFYRIFESALEPKLLMRTSDPSALARVGSVVAALDSRARVRLAPLAANVSEEIAMSRRTAWLAGAFGTLALILATIGMFGVFAYLVQQRTREIGIRMALGARPQDVVRLVLAGNARPVIMGILVGVTGAMASARLMQHLLFGLSPSDPVAHIGGAGMLALAGFAASYVPVRRAVRLDPANALRHD